MKNFYFLLVIFSIFTSCHRDYDKNVDTDTLPAETQTGARTGGAIIDGKVWVATKNYTNDGPGIHTYCEKIKDRTYIKIYLKGIKDNNSIYISYQADHFELNKTYTITPNNGESDNTIYFSRSLDDIFYNTKYDCKLKITRLDLENQIVSGTFELKLNRYAGEGIINIVEGRFDKKFD
ncbi:hypothetical protein ABEG63_10535 [Chryseobacterium sp. C39-AII1]|uniref:hypothetical protein n=1 Tax=Chryseobacterium sp. C39-AII1 TaxID=3080332 RepID=UPI00320A2459